MNQKRPRVLLVGWDAADWKVARPLMERGEMPNLARLVAGGASGNLATIYPVLSPMLWTSIASGKRPAKHGIHGFSEPLPDGSGVRPITTLGRKTKAIWNILHQNGLRPSVVGWWPSHPAEPVRGVMVSNHFHQAGTGEEPRPMLPGTVHPPEWTDRLAELRVTPMELPGELIRLFVPDYQQVDQKTDKRLHSLAKILAETMTVHAAATEVLEHADWDFAAVYYDAIDHSCHGFMRYHPPRLPWVTEEDFAIYQHVVANAYRYHDAMLGRLWQLAGSDATVIVMSDHGFHPDQHRLSHTPAEPAGPAAEHRHFGMLTIHGPGIKAGETIYGAGVLDIAPTLLQLFGLPVGQDMDGKVLLTVFDRPGEIKTVPSWDDEPGDVGTHPPDARLDPVAASEAMKQLVALGYVAPPADDIRQAVAETVAELKYNLARAHDDAGRPDLSTPLYEQLHAGDAEDHRFVERLVSASLAQRERGRAREVFDDFEARCARMAPEAVVELEKRQTETPEDGLDPQRITRHQRELFERRRLAEKATGYPTLRTMLRLRLELAEERFDEVRQRLAEIEALDERLETRARPTWLAQLHAQLGDDEKALAWIDHALERDPDDWQALALAARLHLRNRRHTRALDAAVASLSLIYFQPVTHYIMGRALMARGQHEDAEEALKTAVLQMPGLVQAHETLARLYTRRLGRPLDADRHRLRALELRQMAKDRKTAQPVIRHEDHKAIEFLERASTAPFDPGREIVIVAGLPRSGTSMLMQILEAGGIAVLTDGLRSADEDNPRGYYEYEPVTRLAREADWLSQARGKAIKLALPLVLHLPPGESYRLLVIDRDASEVIASQKRMLTRLNRTGDAANLPDDALVAEYGRYQERFARWLDRHPDVPVLPLNYERILSHPADEMARIAGFLHRPFDQVTAARCIEPSLRRQRADTTDVRPHA